MNDFWVHAELTVTLTNHLKIRRLESYKDSHYKVPKLTFHDTLPHTDTQPKQAKASYLTQAAPQERNQADIRRSSNTVYVDLALISPSTNFANQIYDIYHGFP